MKVKVLVDMSCTCTMCTVRYRKCVIAVVCVKLGIVCSQTQLRH